MADKKTPSQVPMRGILHLYSETGTEGGYWAFQDERFIKPNTTNFHCVKCFKFWDKGRYPEGPPTAESAKSILVVTRSIPVDKVVGGNIPPECPIISAGFLALVSEKNPWRWWH